MSEPQRFNPNSPASRPVRPASGPPGRSDLDLRLNLRLVAAVGMLASAAIATGALVSLLSDDPASESKRETGSGPGLVDPTAAAADTQLELELRVREAELAAARARAALRDAREAGRDERELESYERRLEQLGSSPIESLQRSLGASADGNLAARADQRERRSHLRAIASPSREL